MSIAYVSIQEVESQDSYAASGYQVWCQFFTFVITCNGIVRNVVPWFPIIIRCGITGPLDLVHGFITRELMIEDAIKNVSLVVTNIILIDVCR